jgi:hypothetical protein
MQIIKSRRWDLRERKKLQEPNLQNENFLQIGQAARYGTEGTATVCTLAHTTEPAGAWGKVARILLPSIEN